MKQFNIIDIKMKINTEQFYNATIHPTEKDSLEKLNDFIKKENIERENVITIKEFPGNIVHNGGLTLYYWYKE